MPQDDQADEMEGVEASELDMSPPLLTKQERRILEVYDRLEELQLEIALLKAQGVLSQDDSGEVTEEDIKTAEQELLEAKASYTVRSTVIESVVVANPILKAVHAGSNASVIEQDLLPLIERRDKLSIALTELASKLQAARSEFTAVETEHIITARKNVELSTLLRSLATEAKTWRTEDIRDPKAKEQLDDLEASLKASRQRWRIMKGTVSAVIAGSGVDWARDPTLLQIVLDEDGDE